MTQLPLQIVKEFAKLFDSQFNDFYKFYTKPSGEAAYFRVGRRPQEEDFQRHLAGGPRDGMTIVPVNREGVCMWGAIDIDAKGDEEAINFIKLQERIKLESLPFVICRSKGGKGCHLYVFFKTWTRAEAIRRALKKVARKLDYATAEVFPKQSAIVDEQDTGSGICIPFWHPNQIMFTNGKFSADVSHFITEAKSRQCLLADLQRIVEGENSEAPPCIIKIMDVAAGNKVQRDTTLFHIGVYLKKKYADDWKIKLHDWNSHHNNPPLEFKVVDGMAKKLARTEYKYRCAEEPMCSYCDAADCKQRKFGISIEEHEEQQMLQMPEFSSLNKHEGDVVMWELEIVGTEEVLVLTTEQLLNWSAVRSRAMEVLNRMLPRIKAQTWEVKLGKLLGVDGTALKVVVAPEGTKFHDRFLYLVAGRMYRGAKMAAAPEDRVSDRAFIYTENNVSYMAFRGEVCMMMLARNNEKLERTVMNKTLRAIGFIDKKIRYGKTVYSTWIIEVAKLPVEEERGVLPTDVSLADPLEGVLPAAPPPQVEDSYEEWEDIGDDTPFGEMH